MFYMYSKQNKKREGCFASNPELDKQSDLICSGYSRLSIDDLLVTGINKLVALTSQ